ncbi:hypothetical protein Emed_003269 [Eimeria media]
MSYSFFSSFSREGGSSSSSSVPSYLENDRGRNESNYRRLVRSLQDQILDLLVEKERLQEEVCQHHRIATERDRLETDNRSLKRRLEYWEKLYKKQQERIDELNDKILEQEAKLEILPSLQREAVQTELLRTQLSITETELAFTQEQLEDQKTRTQRYLRQGLENSLKVDRLELELSKAKKEIAELQAELERHENVEFHTPVESPRSDFSRDACKAPNKRKRQASPPSDPITTTNGCATSSNENSSSSSNNNNNSSSSTSSRRRSTRGRKRRLLA